MPLSAAALSFGASQAVAAAELEAIDLPAAAGGGGGGRSSNAHKAADAQKERAHAALVAAVKSEREQLEAVQAEMGTDFTSTLTPAERDELQRLHARIKELHKARDAAASEAAQAESDELSLQQQLNEVRTLHATPPPATPPSTPPRRPPDKPTRRPCRHASRRGHLAVH
jgi:hypothetical protein